MKRLFTDLREPLTRYFVIVLVIAGVGIVLSHKIDWFNVVLFSMCYITMITVDTYVKRHSGKNNK